MELQYRIRFFSRWHAGSGLSGSTYADSLVIRDANDLPYIPGKTLKGLLKEGAEVIHGLHPDLVTQAFVHSVFGRRPEEKPKGASYSTVDMESDCFFTSARPAEVTANAIIHSDQQRHLYQVLASTKINAQGQAEDHTLRQKEVAVPMTLFASIHGFPEESAYLNQIIHCMKWVKRLGGGRTRGLGRCHFEVLN